MKPAQGIRQEQIKELFHSVLEIEPEKRQAYLERHCENDRPLLLEVESLLEHVCETEFLKNSLRDEMADLPAPGSNAAARRQRIGAYRLVRELGRGGMSTVYLAERADDQFRRRVAVKLLQPGMETIEILRRFRQERQILAGLRHPHIAQLLDGGSTEDGRPFIVMEYVEGLAVDEYCARNRLPIPAILDLFRQICLAVHYLHQNLVVHRDLKPSNILVTPDDAPRLLDFGIAKILNPELMEREPQPGGPPSRMMTPGFASPEQARGQCVTTASDVYSLGVVLYLLLTGRRPWEAEAGSLPDTERRIGEGHAVRPSAAAADDPERGPAWRRALAGDLDSIVRKALAPEPWRRYSTAAELANDLSRHLEGRPVLARPGSLGYRMGRFIRRHRSAVAAAAVAWLALAALLVFARLENRRAVLERQAADRARIQAEQLAEVTAQLLEHSDPEAIGTRSPVDRELLDRTADRLIESLQDQPVVRARLLATLGTVYLHQGIPDRARELIAEAVAAQDRYLEADHHDRIRSLHALGKVLGASGDYTAAESAMRDALSVAQRQFGDQDPRLAAVVRDLAIVLHLAGRYEDAELLYQQALDLERQRHRADRSGEASTLTELAELKAELGHLDAADQLYTEALELNREIYGPRHMRVALTLQGLGRLRQYQEDDESAERLYRQAHEMQRDVLGGHHPHALTSLQNLARILVQRQEHDAAEVLLQDVLTRRREIFDGAYPGIADVLGDLAWIEARRGAFDEARPLMEEARDIYRQSLGEDHHYGTVMTFRLGELAAQQGLVTVARGHFKEALEGLRRSLGAAHGLVIDVLLASARLRLETGDRGAAEEEIREAFELAMLNPAYFPRALRAGHLLGEFLIEAGRYEEAEKILAGELADLRSEAGDRFAELAEEGRRETRRLLVRLYEAWGRTAEAARARSGLTGDEAAD